MLHVRIMDVSRMVTTYIALYKFCFLFVLSSEIFRYDGGALSFDQAAIRLLGTNSEYVLPKHTDRSSRHFSVHSRFQTGLILSRCPSHCTGCLPIYKMSFCYWVRLPFAFIL